LSFSDMTDLTPPHATSCVRGAPFSKDLRSKRELLGAAITLTPPREEFYRMALYQLLSRINICIVRMDP